MRRVIFATTLILLPGLANAQAGTATESKQYPTSAGFLAELNKPAVDTSPVPQPAREGNIQRNIYSTRMSMTGNGRTVDVTEPGRTIHVEEKPGSLYLKVTGELDGKPATKEYTAKSADQLKEEHPAAFELYQRHFGMLNRRVGMGINVQGGNVANVRIQINGNNGINIGPAGANVVPGNLRDLANTNILEARLLNAMRAQGIADAQQQEVRDLIAKLRKAIPDPKKEGKEKEAAQVEYEKAGDAVRAKIAELKLGDFDAMLPAKPAQAAK